MNKKVLPYVLVNVYSQHMLNVAKREIQTVNLNLFAQNPQGVFPGILGGGVPPGSLLQTKKCYFPYSFSDLA